MQTHHVHHEKVNFHGDTEDALDLFRSSESRHEFERHVAAAKEHGESRFFVKGNKYILSHERGNGENEEGALEIKKSHH